MTEQEAINVMEKYIDTTISKVVIEAHNMAIKALERQIPKKPKSEGEFLRIQRCPACKKLIGFGQKYCDGCGQKLDWESEE